MKNLQLIRLLRTFTPQEFTEFGKFVKSPFYNESNKLIALYNALKKFYPSFNADKLNKESIFKKLYINEEYNDKKMRDRVSDMQKLAEEFLLVIHLKQNSFERKLNVFKEFTNRRLNVHFEKKYKELKSILENTPHKNELFFHNQYLLSSNALAMYETLHPLGKRKPHFEALNDSIEDFMRYFSVQMLRAYSIMNNVKGVLAFDFDYKFYNSVIDYVERDGMRKYPLIDAFLIMFDLHKDHVNPDSYFKLKKLYNKHHSHMDLYDKIMITTELLIHARLRHSRKMPGFDREVFDVLKLQLEHNAYTMEDGMMKREQFFVFVNHAANLGEFDWVERFIKDYSEKIIEHSREDTVNWAFALLKFNRNEFGNALEHLSTIRNTDYLNYFNTKNLTAKILFELKDYDGVLNLVDSYKHYISSNEFMPEHIRQYNLMYINFVYQMTQLAYLPDEFKIKKFLENPTLENLGIQDQKWVVKKLTELKKKFKTSLQKI